MCFCEILWSHEILSSVPCHDPEASVGQSDDELIRIEEEQQQQKIAVKRSSIKDKV